MKNKMKTRKSVAKRFKKTATGKLKMKKSNLRHILTKKNSDVKRKFRKAGYVAVVDQPRMMVCMPGA